MEMTIRSLIEALEADFIPVENPIKAKQMKAYMKDHFDFYGISAPDRKVIFAHWLPLVKQLQPDFWSLIWELWQKDEREYQMVAVDLLQKRPKKDYSEGDWAEFEWIITQKSWWDTVDLIASNCVGIYLQLFPEKQHEVVQLWRSSDNFWLNRTCLLFQLKYGKKTDFVLLTELIDSFKWNKEFFIQKSIGWSLRQYSKSDAEAVRTYLSSSDLSGLALREASKYL
jgi:3-methyladenine DNA glycosylase AlkD